jgi:hypothetical protein
MTLTVAEQLVASRISVGVTQIYGVVVDSLNPIIDATAAPAGSPRRHPLGPHAP